MVDFNEKDTDSVEIPEFVEDKTESKSIDMSIFKMSDEELYDDVDETEEENEVTGPKRKLNTSGIFAILAVVFLVAAVVLGVLFVKANSNVTDLEAQVKQLQATQATYQQQLQEKDNTISSLNAQIEQMKKVEEAASYKITEEGGVRFRSGASTNATATKYNDSEYAYKNETFKVVSVEKDSAGNKWAKINDNTYFCIEFEGESLATKVE